MLRDVGIAASEGDLGRSGPFLEGPGSGTIAVGLSYLVG